MDLIKFVFYTTVVKKRETRFDGTNVIKFVIIHFTIKLIRRNPSSSHLRVIV